MDSEQKKSDEAALALIVLLIIGLGFLGYGLFSFDCNTCVFNWTDKCDDYCECVEYQQVGDVAGLEDKCLPNSSGDPILINFTRECISAKKI
jgi:hypothetical protein